VVEDLVHLEGHGLTGPHVGNLAEPAIWVRSMDVWKHWKERSVPLMVGCVISDIARIRLFLMCLWRLRPSSLQYIRSSRV